MISWCLDQTRCVEMMGSFAVDDIEAAHRIEAYQMCKCYVKARYNLKLDQLLQLNAIMRQFAHAQLSNNAQKFVPSAYPLNTLRIFELGSATEYKRMSCNDIEGVNVANGA